jgi:lysophospholipase L1-like esterase
VEATTRWPDIIIFAIGANDMCHIKSKDNSGTNIEKFQNDLTELVNQAKKFTDKIIFIGLTKVDELKTMPVSWDSTRFYDNDYVSKYNLVIKEFCQDNKLMFIDMLDLINKEDLEDGLHPNSQGHKKMFERIKIFIRQKII